GGLDEISRAGDPRGREYHPYTTSSYQRMVAWHAARGRRLVPPPPPGPIGDPKLDPVRLAALAALLCPAERPGDLGLTEQLRGAAQVLRRARGLTDRQRVRVMESLPWDEAVQARWSA